MVYKTRPRPLKDLQVAVQADQSRRYLILDAHLSLPSPTYPKFDTPLQQDNPTWQFEVGVHRWNDPVDSRDNNRFVPVRSPPPPISPPALSPCGRDAEYSPKLSGRAFALTPAQVDGKHVFTHVVVNHEVNDQDSRPPPISLREDGLPEDMQDILRQLDDLASWVKAASSSRDRDGVSIVHATRLPEYLKTDTFGRITEVLSDGLFLDKGKNRLPSTCLPGECDVRRDLVVGATIGSLTDVLKYLPKLPNLQDSLKGALPSDPAEMSSSSNCPSEGFIYVPDCNTPEFLAGSSNSPIAYPVCGYSSHPSRYYPHAPETTHEIPYHRRFLECRSAPRSPLNPLPLGSPPFQKTSFKMLFQRSRCNTTAVACPSIPAGHVPVENVLRQGKRLRLPWLRI